MNRAGVCVCVKTQQRTLTGPDHRQDTTANGRRRGGVWVGGGLRGCLGCQRPQAADGRGATGPNALGAGSWGCSRRWKCTSGVCVWSVRLERASWSVCGVTSRALADLCKSQENARVHPGLKA